MVRITHQERAELVGSFLNNSLFQDDHLFIFVSPIKQIAGLKLILEPAALNICFNIQGIFFTDSSVDTIINMSSAYASTSLSI